MWQTKYASAVPKNLGLGLNFRPYRGSSAYVVFETLEKQLCKQKTGGVI